MAEDRTGVVARLDALEAAHRAATVMGLLTYDEHRARLDAGWAILQQVPDLLAVVRGMLARHEPITHRAHPGATFCGECSDYEEGYLREYPCDTVEAVAAALGEA